MKWNGTYHGEGAGDVEKRQRKLPLLLGLVQRDVRQRAGAPETLASNLHLNSDESSKAYKQIIKYFTVTATMIDRSTDRPTDFVFCAISSYRIAEARVDDVSTWSHLKSWGTMDRRQLLVHVVEPKRSGIALLLLLLEELV